MRVEFDRQGQYVIRSVSPNDLSAVDALATAFTSKESTLPFDERGPYTEHIVDLLRRLRLLTYQQTIGRSQALISSGEIKRLYKRAENLVRQIQRTLNEQFAATPEKATQWGFKVSTAGQRAGVVLIPKTHMAILNALEKYINTEKSRPSAEQFSAISITEVVEVYQDLRDQLERQRVGKIARQNSSLAQFEVAQELTDYLHAALVYLVVTRFKRKVTPELKAWGYAVVSRKGALPTTE